MTPETGGFRHNGVGTLVLFVVGGTLYSGDGHPPAPSGTVTVEDRECLVPGRTDSITRVSLSALLALPAVPEATLGRMIWALQKSCSR